MGQVLLQLVEIFARHPGRDYPAEFGANAAFFQPEFAHGVGNGIDTLENMF